LVEDGFEEVESVLVAEGREASNHFVDDAAETPPVDGLIVALLLYHLRRQVLRSTADRHRLLVLEVQSPR
jgi:hypothetical protein